jgi:membrane protein
MAASVAYYTVFSLPPLLFITVAAAGFFFGRTTVEGYLLEQAKSLVGESPASQIETMLKAAGDRIAQGGSALLVSIGALLIAATGVMAQLQVALNRAWEVRPDPQGGGIRRFIVKRLVSFAAIIAIAFLLLVSLIFSAAISAFGGTAFGLLPNQLSQGLLYTMELSASVVLFTAVFAGVFRFLPDAVIRWRDVLVGALFTAVAFTLGKFGLGLYLGNFDVARDFGAAGSLAVIMLWVYYVSVILLLGAEFTQVWARTHGNPVRPERGSIRYSRERLTFGDSRQPRGVRG